MSVTNALFYARRLAIGFAFRTGLGWWLALALDRALDERRARDA